MSLYSKISSMAAKGLTITFEPVRNDLGVVDQHNLLIHIQKSSGNLVVSMTQPVLLADSLTSPQDLIHAIDFLTEEVEKATRHAAVPLDQEQPEGVV